MRPGGGEGENEGKYPEKDANRGEFFVVHKIMIT